MVIPGGNNIGSLSNDAAGKSRHASVSAPDVKNSATNTDAPVKTDNVSISLAGKALAKVEAALANAPDVDMDRVEQVRATIANGSYQVNNDVIAEKMLAQDSALP